MKKQEFEQSIGKEITMEQWKCIDLCYVTYGRLFPDMDTVVDFYHSNGFEIFRKLHEDYLCIRNRNNELFEETQEDESGICQSVDMAALKEHFESITNCIVTDNEYYRIEKCINAFSGLLATDKDIVLFYHTFGMDGVDRLNCHRAGEKAVEDHLREDVHAENRRYLDLLVKYNQLSSYITAFLKALVKFFYEILNDPTFCSHYNNSDYTRAFFISFIDYLNKEIERFESEVK